MEELGYLVEIKGDIMPKKFLECVKNGGKVRTIKLGGNKYRHTCTINGKTYLGHIKTKKKKRK